MPRLAPLLLAVLLAGCQLSAPGGQGPDTLPATAITGGAIEVTALPDLPGGSPPPPVATAETPPETPAETPAADPAPTAETAPPPSRKSEVQIDCERRNGIWSNVSNTSVFTCVKRTRDAGKRCTRQSQCEGECLARSGTCAPIDPLLGCNEVLQDNGARVTLCIE